MTSFGSGSDGDSADDQSTDGDGDAADGTDGDDGDGTDGEGDDEGHGPPPANCGDGILDDGEECDGDLYGWQSCQTRGFLSGTLSCTATCRIETDACILETVCGDALVSGEEDCEGDVAGNTCESLGLGAGSLGCGPDCRFDAAACACKGVGERCAVDWANPGGLSDCCPPGFKGIERGTCGAGSGTCL